LTSKKLSAHC